MLAPFSMKSDLEIHMEVKVLRLLKIEPPIQVRNFLSAGPFTLTGMLEGTREVNSFSNLSGVPGNMVDPPLRTTLVYISLRTSRSHFMID